MKHSNISIFIPHIGCPHRCSFCDQRTISGAQHAPSGDEVREICGKALSEVKEPQNTEIAFFGGSFTAIPRDYMLELLEAAHEFVGEGRFRGIRCSTRPDCIDREVLDILRAYGVTAIELGAQSMNDEVLEANERGHTAQDVVDASRLIKEYGFELGLQMMTGLYKSDSDKDFYTVESIIALKPDTVRIYPVVVLKGTRLAELYESGEFVIDSLFSMTWHCSQYIELFIKSGIKVIKCGLHASEFVEQDMAAGYYHPAFRELCEAMIYRRNMESELRKSGALPKTAVIAVQTSCISKATGQKRSNIIYFKELGTDIRIVGDESVPVYECKLRR